MDDRVVSGSGTFLILDFKVIGTGTSQILLNVYELQDINYNDIPYVISDNVVEVNIVPSE